MNFPSWVNKARGKKAQASARLRYLMYRLAIECSESGSIRDMCIRQKVASAPLVSHYIKVGSFSQSLADRFEAHFGSSIITAAQLTAPLDIGTAASSKK